MNSALHKETGVVCKRWGEGEAVGHLYLPTGFYQRKSKLSSLFVSEIVLLLRARNPLKLGSNLYIEMGEGGMNSTIFLSIFFPFQWERDPF